MVRSRTIGETRRVRSIRSQNGIGSLCLAIDSLNQDRAIVRFAALPLAARIALIGLVLVLAAFAALVLAPPSLVRPLIARELGASVGSGATVGGIVRIGPPSLTPVWALRDVRIAQPGWAGPGDLARAETIRFRLPLLKLLAGRARPEAIVIDGLTLALVRDASKRENWRRNRGGDGGRSGGIADLTIRNGRLTLRDAPRRIAFAGRFSADAAGVRLSAAGRHRDRPLTLSFIGGAPLADRPWPFRVSLASPLARIDAQGRTDRPLAFGNFSARAQGRGADIRYLDDIVEAGLPGTQPITLAGAIRHDGRDWRMSEVAGKVGASPFTGRLAVTREDDRTRLDGAVTFASLNFDDLANDAAQARSAALQRRIGRRVLPGLRIDLSKLARVDGRITVNARRLITGEPTLFRSLRTVLVLDRRKLVASPLVAGMEHGRLEGRAEVDHRGAGLPRLAIDVHLEDGRLEDVLGGPEVRGPLAGRIRLAGRGETARAALARADGGVGLVMRGGDMDRRLAIAMSGNVLKMVGAAIAGGKGREPIRCLAARLNARNGRLSAGPLLIDTPIARADGAGAILLRDESIRLAFRGRAKDPGVLQNTAPVSLIGTLSDPKVEVVPPEARGKGFFAKVGAFLKRIEGRGESAVSTAAPDADCARLAGRTLRGL